MSKTSQTFEGLELPPLSTADTFAWVAGATAAELEELEREIQRGKLTEDAAEALPLHRWVDVGESPTPREWVLTDWLSSGAITLLSGPGGVGKSTLAIQLAAAVAGNAKAPWGGPDIDRRLDGGAAVVFASWEDQPADITRKLANLSCYSSWVRPDIPLHIAGDKQMGMAGGGPLWEAPRRMDRGVLTSLAYRLMAAAENVDAALVILDSAAACYADNENDRAAVRSFLASFHNWAISHECAVLLLAHPPKSGASFSGSTDWQAGCRALWTLGAEPWGQEPKKKEADNRQTYWKLTCEKSNYADGGPPPALWLDWKGPTLMSGGPWDPAAECE